MHAFMYMRLNRYECMHVDMHACLYTCIYIRCIYTYHKHKQNNNDTKMKLTRTTIVYEGDHLIPNITNTDKEIPKKKTRFFF